MNRLLLPLPVNPNLKGSAIRTWRIPASCMNDPPEDVLAREKPVLSGQNGVWRKFTPGEVKPHSTMFMKRSEKLENELLHSLGRLKALST